MRARIFRRSRFRRRHIQRQQPFFQSVGGESDFAVGETSFFNPAATTAVQTKLTIGQPGDKYEREADAMADKVVGSNGLEVTAASSSPAIQTMCADCSEEQGVQRMEEEEPGVQTMPQEEEPEVQTIPGEEEPEVQAMPEEEPEVQTMAAAEEPEVQTKTTTPNGAKTSPSLSAKLTNRTGGYALPHATNSYMSQAFGRDFSQVKVHTDHDAVQMNQELNAKAFTHGSDIYFNQGQYDPSSSAGKRLLAHELTHVVQQKAVGPILQKKDLSATHRSLLRIGDQGAQVRKLQGLLNASGASLVPDGIFGPNTLSAVKRFQGLYAPPVDGIVGPVTWHQLLIRSQGTPSVEEQTAPPSEKLVPAESAHNSVRPSEAHKSSGEIMSILQERFSSKLVSNRGTIPADSKMGSLPIWYPGAAQLAKIILEIAPGGEGLKTIAWLDNQTLSAFGIPIERDQIPYFKVLLLESILQHADKNGIEGLSPDEQFRFRRRVWLMRDFYKSFMPTSVLYSDSEFKHQKALSGADAAKRKTLVALALSDVGRVAPPDKDAAAKPTKVGAPKKERRGWRYLKRMYMIGLNTTKVYPDSYFQYYQEKLDCAHGDDVCVESKKKNDGVIRANKWPLVPRDRIGSWCGIAAAYWLRLAGRNDSKWVWGAGIKRKLAKRPFNQVPVVGDILTSNKHENHHAIITWVDPAAEINDSKNPKLRSADWKKIQIRTVEGNVNAMIEVTPSSHDKLAFFDGGAHIPF